MATREITPEKAAENVYTVSHAALGIVSGVYKGMMATSRYIDAKTDNTVGRLTGVAYYAKTMNAVIGGLKDVQTRHIATILMDGEKSFSEKVKESVRHVKQNFSHEATVGAAMFFGKEALIVAPLALGVSALVAAMAPAAAATAGVVAGVGMMKAVKYYLSTHAGHNLEVKMADKVARGMQLLSGIRGAAGGRNVEMAMVADVADKMEAAAHAHHAHDHGHGHHHHGFKSTVKQDLVALVRVDRYPKELATYAVSIGMDCAKLFGRVMGIVMTAPQQTMEQSAPKAQAATHEEKAPVQPKKPQATAPKM